MTSQQTIVIDSIDEDRRFWRAVIKAIGEDPLRVRPGHMPWLIARYKEALTKGDTLPPTVLIRAGEKLYLYDGHHRLCAHRAAGRTEIDAVLYEEKDFLAAFVPDAMAQDAGPMIKSRRKGKGR